MVSEQVHREVHERLDKGTALCEDIQRAVIDAPVHIAEQAEGAIMRILSKSLLQTGGIVEAHMDEANALRRMCRAGSKGSFINLSQIGAALGQQSLEGARVASQGSTLPCFSRGDRSLAACGMVYNSFSLGLSPPELMHHAVGGREGLVDTAVKTATSGYTQRKMNKAVEDMTVHPDGTLRLSTGDVVGLRWGGDGLHPARVQRVPLKSLRDADIMARFTKEEALIAREARAAIMAAKTHVLATEFDPRVLVPFNPVRMAARIARAVDAAAPPLVGIEAASEASVSLARFAPSAPTTLAVLEALAAHKVARMNANDHTALCVEVRSSIMEAMAAPGDSVGCIAAQSIGEPCTQLTLNSFHTSGVAAKNVSTGIPRLRELLDASKAPKTPCCTLHLLPGFAASESYAEYLASTLPCTRLDDLVDFCTVREIREPERFALQGGEKNTEKETALQARYETVCTLNQEVMREKQLTPPMLRRVVRERFREKIKVWSSEANDSVWELGLQFVDIPEMLERASLPCDLECNLFHRATTALMESMVVCGHIETTTACAAVQTRLTPEGESISENVVYAYGTNILQNATYISGCDWQRTTTDNIWEVYNVLGIEACAHVIFDQLKTVLCYDGTYVDDRHLLVMVDTMCRGGSLMPLNRYGINRDVESSPLMRCSFEETVDTLCDAALFAEDENARGITTAVMSGQAAEMGTGTVEIFVSKTDAPTRTPKELSRGHNMWRSTCRSYVKKTEESGEYIVDTQISTVSSGKTSPVRKRPRFRPGSPIRHGS